jgi:6-methylsalicylic acid synthase
MAASTEASAEFIEAELDSKGITSISRDEAFCAWDHVAKYDISHGVVLRSRVLEADEVLPMDILEEIAIRRSPNVEETTEDTDCAEDSDSASASEPAQDTIPAPGPERIAYLVGKISACVASVLQLPDANDVDSKVALPELGMDSVMTVALRRQLQTALGVKVPPTLVWGHPTVSHLAKWFADKVVSSPAAAKKTNTTTSPKRSSPSPAPAVAKETAPAPGPERIAYLVGKVSACVASVLQLPDVSDVDPKVALPELGMDSVMTVALRRQLQSALGVKVPPTLVWGHPTVSHLSKWFADKV